MEAVALERGKGSGKDTLVGQDRAMVQQLTALAALAEDLNWVHSTHVQWLTTPDNSSYKGSTALPRPPQVLLIPTAQVPVILRQGQWYNFSNGPLYKFGTSIPVVS